MAVKTGDPEILTSNLINGADLCGGPGAVLGGAVTLVAETGVAGGSAEGCRRMRSYRVVAVLVDPPTTDTGVISRICAGAGNTTQINRCGGIPLESKGVRNGIARSTIFIVGVAEPGATQVRATEGGGAAVITLDAVMGAMNVMAVAATDIGDGIEILTFVVSCRVSRCSIGHCPFPRLAGIVGGGGTVEIGRVGRAHRTPFVVERIGGEAAFT